MTKKIFHTIFMVAVCIFLASALLFMGVLYDYFSNVQQNQLKIQTNLVAQGIKENGLDYFDGLDLQDSRITWINTDGSVLYDSVSNVDEMENHFEREEIKEALANGYGSSSRYSSTLTTRYLYSAKRMLDGTIIRLAVTQNSLLILTLGMIHPLMIIFGIAIVLSAYLAYRLSKKIVQPLNEINLDDPLKNDGYDELSPLLHRLDIQQRQIRMQSSELRRKQSEFETVTRGMNEGIILLNSHGNILSINRAACDLLNVDHLPVGEDILSLYHDALLFELLDEANQGICTERIISLKDGQYRLSADPVMSHQTVSGIVLLLIDVTEKEKAEQIRREFTANVSHELKTPLHTISGCAELLSNGLVKEEDIPHFSKQIYTESCRMIQLVDDIIKLSRLDEGARDMPYEEVDLRDIAQDTIESLKAIAQSLDVKIVLEGESALLYGIPQLLKSIVYNLYDNALKYNRRGGSVTVTIQNEDNHVILYVADTGIGISAEHQERIFERFYRVDKSHSKATGGTGLGLSIVKHAAKIHRASIDLHSTLGQGTTIIVTFPKEK